MNVILGTVFHRGAKCVLHKMQFNAGLTKEVFALSGLNSVMLLLILELNNNPLSITFIFVTVH
jgi:hypothetical protein